MWFTLGGMIYDETIMKDVRNALFANKTHKISLPRAAVVQAQAKQYNLPTMYDPNVFFLVWGSGLSLQEKSEGFFYIIKLYLFWSWISLLEIFPIQDQPQ